MKIGKYDIGVTFAWDIWCIGAFWFGIGKEKRLHIFPLPFVVIVIEYFEGGE